MAIRYNKHVFSVELPYEEDQVVTLFLRDNFARVDSLVMSLGQMSNIPPTKLVTYQVGEKIQEKEYIKNHLKASGIKLYFLLIPKALFSVTLDTFRALRTVNFKCDIFFAQHFLPAFIAVILRKLRILKCQKIVFWMFDFFIIPPEFPRNWYYKGMDSIQGFIRARVDEIWYTTPRLSEVDQARFGPLPKKVKKKFTHGCFFRRINLPKVLPLKPIRLGFLGSLRQDTGIYEAIEAIDKCLKNNMRVELAVIGSGPEEEKIRKIVKKKKLEGLITFYGFEDRGEKIAKILSECHFGLALYPAHPYSPNWYLTSGKFRRYISQKLPVIVSTVPYFAKYIYDFNAGFIIDNDSDDILKALKLIYNNPLILERMRQGVDELYNLYQADKVLKKAFDSLYSYF